MPSFFTRVPLPPRTHENNGQNPGLRYLATLGSETRYLCGDNLALQAALTCYHPAQG